MEKLFAAAVERFDRIDGVVSAAGVVAYGRFEEIPADVFDAVHRTNLLGSANVARCALRHFQEQGSLVLVGSVLGKIVTLLPPVFDRLVGPLMAVLGSTREARDTGPGNVYEPDPRVEAVHGPWWSLPTR